MAKSPPAGQSGGTLSFEDAMRELETIVHAMEEGDMPLDDLVATYERGSRLLSLCQQRLDAAQQRIEIVNRSASGEVSLEPASPGPAEDPPQSGKAKVSRKSSSPDNAERDEIRLL